MKKGEMWQQIQQVQQKLQEVNTVHYNQAGLYGILTEKTMK